MLSDRRLQCTTQSIFVVTVSDGAAIDGEQLLLAGNAQYLRYWTSVWQLGGTCTEPANTSTDMFLFFIPLFLPDQICDLALICCTTSSITPLFISAVACWRRFLSSTRRAVTTAPLSRQPSYFIHMARPSAPSVIKPNGVRRRPSR